MKSSYINKKSVKTLSVIAVASLGLLLSAASSRASVTLYNFSVPTDDLNANPSGAPYSLGFELASTSVEGINTATISNFNVVGPSTSPIVLTDNTPFATDIEPFTPNPSPGGLLTFTVGLTNNTVAGFLPDEFSFFILDNSGFPIPTTDTTGADSLADVDLGGSSNPTVVTFDGTGIYADVAPTVESVVPEPSPAVALTSAFLGVGALIFYRKRSSAKIA